MGLGEVGLLHESVKDAVTMKEIDQRRHDFGGTWDRAGKGLSAHMIWEVREEL
jgi:hypothetical protein